MVELERLSETQLEMCGQKGHILISVATLISLISLCQINIMIVLSHVCMLRIVYLYNRIFWRSHSLLKNYSL